MPLCTCSKVGLNVSVKDDESKHPAPRINNARIENPYIDALEEIRNALQCSLISDPRGK
ncbi:hypothetical protein DPMN_139772 [Dreissena polymorpha]|uniref:Uncharacterized protein n=1 Tax=Dreissena polymorpha TaxID=45954 RepID=A0A9D4G9L4_DREPO|nr:hypothetical protein DPMN_139772 [Dreissena polymorpha]